MDEQQAVDNMSRLMESVLVEALSDVQVAIVAAVDGSGVFLTEESARQAGELISTELTDALVAEFYILPKPAEEPQ